MREAISDDVKFPIDTPSCSSGTEKSSLQRLRAMVPEVGGCFPGFSVISEPLAVLDLVDIFVEVMLGAGIASSAPARSLPNRS